MKIGTVLVTGAGGFIGGRLVQALRRDGVRVVAMRHSGNAGPDRIVADLLDCASLERACTGIDTVVHCAGYAHAFGTSTAVSQDFHHRINFIGTRDLAEAAGRAGVGRMVFLSSVKAMGPPGARCVDESWPSPPDTPYGQAKRAAEGAVLAAGARYGMRVTNLRLAMVYGRGSRGNLERMARAMRAGWFPPLPETGATRSLVHVDDVVAAVRCVLADGRANGRTWIVANPQACSGAEIHDALRTLLGKRPPSWRVPEQLLRSAGRIGDMLARLSGRPFVLESATVERLLGPECYCSDAIRHELGWRACVPLHDGLREMLGPSPSAASGESKQT